MLRKEETNLIRKRNHSTSRHLAMIITSTYRYKPPPRRKGRKLAEIAGGARDRVAGRIGLGCRG